MAPVGFIEVARVSLVESLVRETLSDAEQDWWNAGRPGNSEAIDFLSVQSLICLER